MRLGRWNRIPADAAKNPHPDPLPEYMERGKKGGPDRGAGRPKGIG